MKQQVQADKELLAAKEESKRLKDSLQEAKRRVPELQTQLGEHKQARANTMVFSMKDNSGHSGNIICGVRELWFSLLLMCDRQAELE